RAAECRSECVEHFAKSLCTPDQGESSGRTQKSCSGADPCSKRAARTHMGRSARFLGRCPLPRGIIEGGIHQNAHLRFGRKTRSCKDARGRSDIQVCYVDPCDQSVVLGVLARECRKTRIRFNQGNTNALDANGECEP